VGGFHNGLSEDKDWSMRAVAKGFRLIYDHDLVVSHPSRQDWSALRRKWHRVTMELFASHGTGFSKRVSWGCRGVAMPFSIFAHTPKILTSHKLPGFSDKLRAIGTLARLRLVRMIWMLRQAAGLKI